MTSERLKKLVIQTEEALKENSLSKLITIGRELYKEDDLDLDNKSEWFESMLPPEILIAVQKKVM